ncbi:50S ribosomal protein mrp49 [Grosmannia clavigera kw1407]|uniref:50S ribosomal protein mrp49 n=1 Tax=Grosmannia clavigera (strain kw1407 / UAMH 11150) TaxID=655863 RepID=F0X7Y2_GROCL|nr:50S ribosomal protein mrp49 [Grosmannia clavigera kw1407]EFX06292.1 50S ribosomal protein mrp49 [Grosmannia clavigera kw1407]
MVGVARRMNKLKALLNIRHGPGAALLPSEVSRIHLEFAQRWNDGQYGPRKFWQTCLPRLKYWNPAVPMIVNRTSEATGPATLTIYFRQKQEGVIAAAEATEAEPQPSSSFVGESKAPQPTPTERTVQIDMKGLRSDAILQDFLSKSGAIPVSPSSQEQADMREVEERAERASVDREVMLKYLTARRREAALLAQAKSEVDSLKQSV